MPFLTVRHVILDPIETSQATIPVIARVYPPALELHEIEPVELEADIAYGQESHDALDEGMISALELGRGGRQPTSGSLTVILARFLWLDAVNGHRILVFLPALVHSTAVEL